MAIETDREYIKMERDYSQEQNQLNREHVERMKDKEIDLERYKFDRLKYLNPLKEVLRFPLRVILILPLSLAILRKRTRQDTIDKILELING